MILAYERRTHFPTRIGNARFQVDDAGAVSVQVNKQEPALGEDWRDDSTRHAAKLADARATVEDILARHGFFNMAPRTDDEYDDGYSEQLTYWDAAGAPRTVVVDRARLPPFRSLVNALAASLGITDELG
jgi:hypothetical protein